MAKGQFQFGQDGGQDFGDGRLDAPAFHRNHQAIVEAITPYVNGLEGHALEIGSGTGQHVVSFAEAFPKLMWWPSDPVDAHRVSIDAWAAASKLANIAPSVAIDAAKHKWRLGEEGYPPGNNIRLIVCLNVIHIAPWEVATGIIEGAAHVLPAGGLMVFYGPFMRAGRHTAESNARFDQSLRARNDAWGVRDLTDVNQYARACDFSLLDVAEMPANNLTVIFAKS